MEVERIEKRGSSAGDWVWWREAQRLGGAATDMILAGCGGGASTRQRKRKRRGKERAWQGKCALKLEQA